MSVSIATRPIYPLVGEVVASFTATVGDAVRVYVTAAPEGSQYAKDIATAGGPVLVHEGDADRAWRWQVDAPGVYVLRVDELDFGVTEYAGGWRGSPARARSETVVSSQTANILVGQPMKQPLGWGKNRGVLVCHLFGDYVRELTVAINGEVSPRLEQVSPLMLTADVQEAVDALANQRTGTLLSTIESIAAAFAAAFNLHIASATYHLTADTTNDVPASYLSVNSAAGLGQMIAYYQDALRRHIRDYAETASPSTTGFGKGGYHGGTTVEALPQAPGASDAAGCLIALGELIAAYDAHRASTAAHLSADPGAISGTPPGLGTLLALHHRVAKALRLADTNLTPTEHSGVPSLVALGGFAKS